MRMSQPICKFDQSSCFICVELSQFSFLVEVVVVCALAFNVAKTSSHYDRFAISVPTRYLLLFDLLYQDGKISGSKGPWGTRSIGVISDARFILQFQNSTNWCSTNWTCFKIAPWSFVEKRFYKLDILFLQTGFANWFHTLQTGSIPEFHRSWSSLFVTLFLQWH